MDAVGVGRTQPSCRSHRESNRLPNGSRPQLVVRGSLGRQYVEELEGSVPEAIAAQGHKASPSELPTPMRSPKPTTSAESRVVSTTCANSLIDLAPVGHADKSGVPFSSAQRGLFTHLGSRHAIHNRHVIDRSPTTPNTVTAWHGTRGGTHSLAVTRLAALLSHAYSPDLGRDTQRHNRCIESYLQRRRHRPWRTRGS